MKFRTEVNKYQATELIDYTKKVLCIGSCFAEHLHDYLDYRKYDTFLNPCGITYNPLAIAKSISYITGNAKLKKEDILEKNGIYFHYDFHSSFSSGTLDKTYNNIKEYLEKAATYADADVLIVSLGTAYTYFLEKDGTAVNNCHKVPASEFNKKMLTVDESLSALSAAIAEVSLMNPDLKVLITVSPVRHLRDGMVENNLSKAVLLLACHSLQKVCYFPSYELLLDDLRDYRFYGRDLVHPSEEAVEYILDFFNGQFLSVNEEECRKRIVQVRKELSHRPFQEHSEQHQKFLLTLIAKMESLYREFDVDFNEEINVVKAKIE